MTVSESACEVRVAFHEDGVWAALLNPACDDPAANAGDHHTIELRGQSSDFRGSTLAEHRG